MQVSKLLERLATSGSKVQLFDVLRSSGVSIMLFPPGAPLCGRVAWLDELEGGAWLGSFECKSTRDNKKTCASGSGFVGQDGAAWLLAWPPIAIWRVTYGATQYVTFDAVDNSTCGEFDWGAMAWSGDCEWMIGESDVFHLLYRNTDVLPPYPLVGTVYKDEVFGAYLFITDPPSFTVGERPPRGRRPRFAIYIAAYAEEGAGEEESAEEEVYIYPIPLPEGDFDPSKVVSSIIGPKCQGRRGMSPRVYGMPASERGPPPEPEEEGGDEYDVDDGNADEEGGDEFGDLPGEEEAGDYEEA